MLYGIICEQGKNFGRGREKENLVVDKLRLQKGEKMTTKWDKLLHSQQGLVLVLWVRGIDRLGFSVPFMYVGDL
jgi:hypothetical protein